MVLRIRCAFLAALSSLALVALAAPAANAGVLSLLPGSCGNEVSSQPFAKWGDSAYYAPVPNGGFESAIPSWLLTGGAKVAAGNESYNVGGAGSHSLTLPVGSSATSLYSCTSIYHPTVRLFVRNTGAASSRLKVQALYPGLLGGVQTATVGELSGSSSWAPSPTMPLLVSNLMATLSLQNTAIAFRLTPDGAGGAWSVDDVYLDPFHRG
jgi:hypothetical protein